VAEKLQRYWSPEQIAGWLQRSYPEDESLQVSHETIYRSLFVQSRGALKKELLQYLRSGQTVRRGQRASRKGGSIVNPISIAQRPAEAEDRAVPGHWEGDLLAGSGPSFIATLVERHTRYTMLAKLPDKRTETVVNALRDIIQRLPDELSKSLTWDRGKELADHKRFTVMTNVPVYFCDPNAPWQRGSNENTNGLLRQYLPKGTDLSVHSQDRLDWIARELNERPRKTLHFMTPAQRLEECVAATS
jgi:IS30 family transposase